MDFFEETIYFNNSLLEWSYFAAALTLTFLSAKLISRTLIKILDKAAKKTENKIDDAVISLIRSPLQFTLRVLGIYLSVVIIRLPQTLETFIYNLLDSLIIFAVFWVLHSSIDMFEQSMQRLGKEKEGHRFAKKLSTEILNFVSKAIKVFIVLLGGMSILQEWGLNVSGFIASLGLGGLAFALAAKDTAANLFGSLVILADKPFNVGDWVQTPDVEGTIEEIGIRSTKVRTFAQALVTVPNAQLANSSIINWSRMGKRRIKTTIGLTYSTSTQQIEQILEDLKSYLKSHEGVDQEAFYINFEGFGSSSLDIFCYFFTKTTNWGEFMNIREEIFLNFMQIIETKNGASFAFPSRSLYIEQGSLQ